MSKRNWEVVLKIHWLTICCFLFLIQRLNNVLSPLPCASPDNSVLEPCLRIMTIFRLRTLHNIRKNVEQAHLLTVLLSPFLDTKDGHFFEPTSLYFSRWLLETGLRIMAIFHLRTVHNTKMNVTQVHLLSVLLFSFLDTMTGHFFETISLYFSRWL